jgi:toxin CcdB
MAYLDVFPNPDRGTQAAIPYLVNVQNQLLDVLSTTLVIPLTHPRLLETSDFPRLNPLVTVLNTPLVALTQNLAAIPRRLLKHPVANLAVQRAEIVSALDFLFTGF